MARAPDLRFRVNERSAFGRRLRALDEDQRKSLFDAVIDAGLQALDSEKQRDTPCGQLAGALELLEGLHQRWERLEIQLSNIAARLDAVSRGQSVGAASTTLSSFPDACIADSELTTLIGTLGRWGPDA